ncbi:Eukaryotic translation initiation factor 4E-binding protein 1 [Lemmus lemmus]
MECRNSPVAKTPPKDLPAIPGVTSPTSDEPPMQVSQSHLHSPEDKRAGGGCWTCPGSALSVFSGDFQVSGEGGDGWCLSTLCGGAVGSLGVGHQWEAEL